MKIIGVIPARWGSTRFEGKVLAEIHGKPMLQHVFERAKKSRALNDVIIACDDERILKAANAFGAKAVMTSPKHPSGTDRIAEAVRSLKVDIVVNIQGDEPLIQPKVINDLVKALQKDKSCVMATTIKAVTDESDLNNPNVVKAVVDKNNVALYFSRSCIPFNRGAQAWKNVKYYKHLGLYAYRKSFLMKFMDLPKSALETAERLEQLRVLEAGYKIKTIETTVDTIGVDTPEDLVRVINLK